MTLPVIPVLSVMLSLVSTSFQQVPTKLGASLGVPFDIQKDWAESCPYFPLADYTEPPSGCKITQVNILQRHGARFPTSSVNETIVAALTKLKSVKKFTDARLNFVSNFTYDLGVNDLVPFGAQESFDAGEQAFNRYSSLIGEENVPFVRADSSSRVVMSANNWTAGFAAASKGRFRPVLSVILSDTGNDTLEDASCPNAGNSDTQTLEWLETFAPPITELLNEGAPGANLTDTDVFGLANICPFQTVATETPSPFCQLFETIPDAFPNFAYFGDLDKFYGTGYGQPLGPVQGVGWVNELLARLTNSPVQDHTQTNSTLDSSPLTFPLNRTVYADFSHDDQITAIMCAIGLFKQPGVEPLDPTKPNNRRIWRASTLVPFSSRMVVERLDCTSTRGMSKVITPSVRLMVNQQIQPLEFCGADEHGVCTLDAFVQSQSFARSGGNFAECFS